jgi:hypothetical protein
MSSVICARRQHKCCQNGQKRRCPSLRPLFAATHESDIAPTAPAGRGAETPRDARRSRDQPSTFFRPISTCRWRDRLEQIPRRARCRRPTRRCCRGYCGRIRGEDRVATHGPVARSRRPTGKRRGRDARALTPKSDSCTELLALFLQSRILTHAHRKLCGMPVIPVPVAGERQGLLEYLRYHHTAFLAVNQRLDR